MYEVVIFTIVCPATTYGIKSHNEYICVPHFDNLFHFFISKQTKIKFIYNTCSFCLLLLLSRPDKFHTLSLYRILSINIYIENQLNKRKNLCEEFNSTIADCRLQGTASSPSNTNFMERVVGIEPTFLAWKARVLADIRYPHNYWRREWDLNPRSFYTRRFSRPVP